ncbi:unnamed protein product [Rotaria sp. Silwood1]|nr:unnamed protein product [Rotaria sp. Silwood1]CAF1617589.1 unnamed protein product [Rotaria sp. Silwood1]CAF3760503.1 unnamed protein product [Rotaria sp. Silwood1]CAF3790038.1 unnamed protein product [Rotaria sp. Silwood1]CAF4740722.1 unnamed protein product [Rotaria sp. Silwood1]
MEATLQLSDIVQQLGKKYAFSNYKANFTGIVSGKRSEAAADAAAILICHEQINPPQQPIEFKPDHPFLFLIRESRQNIVLFSGRFILPSTNS